MNFDPDIVVFAALVIAIIILVVWTIILERRIHRLMAGKNGSSLEETIASNQRAIAEMERFRNTMESELAKLHDRVRRKVHGAKTLRFNPFAGTGTGGNQSFATALLDEDGNGVVLSTLYSRDKVSVFAKPIAKRQSEFELTDEEREVLK